jgi:Uma2 family endonuclease
MSALANPSFRLTPEEYLAIERQAEQKSELVNGRLVAMAGASRFHNRIAANLLGEFGRFLKGTPCQAFGGDLKIQDTASGSYFYPDIVVGCGNLIWRDEAGDVLLNPTVLIEVLSPSTERYDKIQKLRHYQAIPSVREIVLISPQSPFVIHLVRDDHDDWRTKFVSGIETVLTFSSLNLTLPLADIYDRIRFDGPEPELT